MDPLTNNRMMARRHHRKTAEKSEKHGSSGFSHDSSGGVLWTRVLFRLLFFAYYAAEHVGEVYLLPTRSHLFQHNPYAGRWKYLTSLNLSLQLAYFFSALAADLIPRSWGKDRLRRLSDSVFTTLAFPFTMSITVAFWSIYWYDRELIYPASLDEVIHPIINHIIHTFILPIAIAEVLLARHVYPSKRKAVLIIFIAHAMYTVWVVWIHYHTGKWVYGYMKKNSRAGFIALLPMRTFGTFTFYMAGKTISSFVWH